MSVSCLLPAVLFPCFSGLDALAASWLERLLLILIFTFVHLSQFKQLFELTKPWFLQGISIHKFSVSLEPVEHIMLFYSMLRWISMILLYEGFHLIISCQPTRLLIHLTSSFLHHTSLGLLCGTNTNLQNCQREENIRLIRAIRVQKRNICGLCEICVTLEVFESFDVY